MSKKKRSSKRNKRVKIDRVEAIEAATLEELCHKLNQKTAKENYRYMEGSLAITRNEFFQNHSCIIFREIEYPKKGAKK